MPINAMPALDQRVCGSWSEQDINMYQHLDYYLDKAQIDLKKYFPIFDKIVTKKRPFKANEGTNVRVVSTNPSPDLRQFAFPQPMSQGAALMDIMDVTETVADAQICWHKFRSPAFNFYPTFRDFMKHIEDHRKDIQEKIMLYQEKFLRGMMFHMSPYLFVAQADGTAKLVLAPYWPGTGTFNQAAGGDGKSTNFLTALFNGAVTDINGNVAQPTGNLRITVIEHAMTIAENDLGVPFFSGSELPKEDQPLDGKFLIAMDSEAWNWLIYDPFVQGNRTLNFDIVTNGFKGSFFGRATSRIEGRPMRFTSLGVANPPERRVSNPGMYNDGRTEPNPDYTKLADADPTKASPYGVAWLFGKNGYETLQVGAPPSEFTGNEFPNAPGMQWNGTVRLTKNFLINCVDSDGNVIQDANTDGEWIKFHATGTFGIVPTQRSFAIPIIYARKRGPA